MKNYRFFLFFFLSSLSAFAQTDTTQYVVPNRRNSPAQQQKPYVIMISADGYRYDYTDKYRAVNLKAFREQGVQASSLIPSFPSKTFPNHYTLATGLYPAHHGLINNSFYDPQRQEKYRMSDRSKVEDGSWYGGIPLWVLAEQQQKVTASFYWTGSEAAIAGIRPTYYYNYSEKIPMDRRIQVVKDWLTLPEDKRPHLIMFYLPEVDHKGHRYGPDSPETAEAVQELDHQIKMLTDAVATTGLPVNYVFVSDHGMTRINTDNTLPLPAAVDKDKFLVSDAGMVVELHAKDKSAIKSTYEQLKEDAAGYKVYLKTEMPKKLFYGAKDDTYNRIGDIILLSEWPQVFSFSQNKPNPGTHGYDPEEVAEMDAVFYAWGPAFKSGLRVPSFKNIHVYPIVTSVLGLPYKHKIDGRNKVAKKILK